jgi:hypothetical protein
LPADLLEKLTETGEYVDQADMTQSMLAGPFQELEPTTKNGTANGTGLFLRPSALRPNDLRADPAGCGTTARSAQIFEMRQQNMRSTVAQQLDPSARGARSTHSF